MHYCVLMLLTQNHMRHHAPSRRRTPRPTAGTSSADFLFVVAPLWGILGAGIAWEGGQVPRSRPKGVMAGQSGRDAWGRPRVQQVNPHQFSNKRNIMMEWSMSPAQGERVLRFVGDTVRFSLGLTSQAPLPEGWRGFLRTNLGRAGAQRAEIIRAHTEAVPVAGASWRDIPLRRHGHEWVVELPLTEVGYFKAKAYAVDPQGRQFWPEGSDVGVAIHPDAYRTGNTIYCAFTRMFGPAKGSAATHDASREAQFAPLDQEGYAIIPPSGKLRDLTAQVPHITGALGCRILHLLPVNPTPTVYARFGRYGSPYASLDFTAIDPALVVFDRRTTAVDQFKELTWAMHARGGRVFLDLAINHTGWGSVLIDEHPEWFLRNDQGQFVSPGAWGTVWEDLVELAHRTPDLWDNLAEAFLIWCRRGVDGFRCDAGYKVPLAAWQYIIAHVRREFPETLFLLEGLGGSWEATEALLTEGGMQWAYSELFQNYSGHDVASYLDYSLRQSSRVGCYVHYSETHDNQRLAAQGRAWSLLRNRLCALTSASGGYGFTCGVEWLAAEKVNVHRSSGLSWGNPSNIINELHRLNHLLSEHPCFFDGAVITRLSGPDSAVYALRREAPESGDQVLVLINTDAGAARDYVLAAGAMATGGRAWVDLLEQAPPEVTLQTDGAMVFRLPPAGAFCLSANSQPAGLTGAEYRRLRAQAAGAITAICQVFPAEQVGRYDWRALAQWMEQVGPRAFLTALGTLDADKIAIDPLAALREAAAKPSYPTVVTWRLLDRTRQFLVPPGHWLLVEDPQPFRVTLRRAGGDRVRHAESILIGQNYYAGFPPVTMRAEGTLELERYAAQDQHVTAPLSFLTADPDWVGGAPVADLDATQPPQAARLKALQPQATMALLTNGRGGMARLAVDLGQIHSKYDCLLGANLNATVPVDRHIFAKRVRVWVNADGFLSPLDARNLVDFTPGPPAVWRFVANAGDGRTVEIHLVADMLDQRNTTVLRFTRPPGPPARGRDLPAGCDTRLTVRVDIEDRGYHAETHFNGAADHHFHSHSRPLPDRPGFEFTPAADRHLRVVASAGLYHHEGEWSQNIGHPVERSRGQVEAGDAFSPGWFEIPLAKGDTVDLTASADTDMPSEVELRRFADARLAAHSRACEDAGATDAFGLQLVRAIQAFFVNRAGGRTVIAGYPWFLDWGRDSLICARGALAAGMTTEVADMLALFGRFAEQGTLPNYICGNDATNRETSDAPLWYGVACEETAEKIGDAFYARTVDPQGRTIAEVLREIAQGCAGGTPHGVRMDPATGLIWSPPHFTWMDTNYPAGTPREGYPVEIQALWIRLLRQLGQLFASGRLSGKPVLNTPAGPHDILDLAGLAARSFERLFWLEERGYCADVLLAPANTGADQATPDDALRSNGLLAISLGILDGPRAQRCVDAAAQYLVTPGALRSLAPLPVSVPLRIHAPDGRPLNDPFHPYWGRYEGDEDTRRKPAYHNGTAWTWTFPVFCEALARAWNFSPAAVNAARAYLGSAERLLTTGSLGHLPEIVDGDYPHQQRGCDAQAWGATETFRVWKLLQNR